MSNIKNWSTTPANNNATPPDGMPEGQLPSTVNDSARQRMADHRTQWEDAEWFDWGHVLTRQSNNSFKVSSDVRNVYTSGRRLKMYDTTTIYGEIVASSLSGPDTLVTVSSSNLSTSLSSAGISILNPANLSIPAAATGITNATLVSLTGTSLDFTGIPSWAKRVNVMVINARTDGTNSLIIQVGDSGGIETSGYAGTVHRITSFTSFVGTQLSAGFTFDLNPVAGDPVSGMIMIQLANPTTHTWVAHGLTGTTVASFKTTMCAGHTALTGGPLDRIRITSTPAGDTWAAGVAVISYE